MKNIQNRYYWIRKKHPAELPKQHKNNGRIGLKCFSCLKLPHTLVIPQLFALQNVDKIDGQKVRGILPIIKTCSQKAQISAALKKRRRDVRKFETTLFPTSKKGTLDSLNTFVEKLRAEVHVRKHFGSSRVFSSILQLGLAFQSLFGSSADLNNEKERFLFRPVHGESR